MAPPTLHSLYRTNLKAKKQGGVVAQGDMAAQGGFGGLMVARQTVILQSWVRIRRLPSPH
jgi:hypothetical protein